eukprot:1031484-Pleurochrysis_carterae.AAC.1
MPIAGARTGACEHARASAQFFIACWHACVLASVLACVLVCKLSCVLARVRRAPCLHASTHACAHADTHVESSARARACTCVRISMRSVRSRRHIRSPSARAHMLH